MTETAAGVSGRFTRPQRWLLPGDLLTEPADLAAAAPGAPGTGVRFPHPRPPRRTPRDWAVDVTLFGWSLGMWALMVIVALPTLEHTPEWIRAIDAPLGLLACCALWVRRRHPLAVALLVVPVGAVSASAFGALGVVMLSTALRLPTRRALALLAANIAVAIPYFIFCSLPEDNSGWGDIFFSVAYLLTFFAWGVATRARRQLVVRLRQDAGRERAEHARRMADARRAEREAIAREMHDVLAHRISLLSVHAGALAYRTSGAAGAHAKPLSDAEVGESAQVIRDNAHQALEELREVLTVLRGTAPGALTEAGGGRPQPRIAEIGELVAEATRAGQRVVLDQKYAEGAAEALRDQAQRTVYRVVQEGLTNARKHAPGALITVTLVGAAGQGLTVRIRNPLPVTAGAGREHIPGAGAGLAGLEERIALDGGSLLHGATNGAFELVAKLPWPAA
ncbi:sensor histidine kinase [Streptomyces xiamenensis]|uniref:histidine kinase n=1 Tax=Streptomyces xiamenensis TaxID=408015 RepID=A0A0F7CPE2_9ACTN|nr:histidine kinase [Streptomyces xiamenensis]AKG44506.1 histidine kinase [Streptomyces xiamenensis]